MNLRHISYRIQDIISLLRRSVADDHHFPLRKVLRTHAGNGCVQGVRMVKSGTDDQDVGHVDRIPARIRSISQTVATGYLISKDLQPGSPNEPLPGAYYLGFSEKG